MIPQLAIWLSRCLASLLANQLCLEPWVAHHEMLEMASHRWISLARTKKPTAIHSLKASQGPLPYSLDNQAVQAWESVGVVWLVSW